MTTTQVNFKDICNNLKQVITNDNMLQKYNPEINDSSIYVIKIFGTTLVKLYNS